MKRQLTPTTAKALKLRRRIKKKKPDFARPESWRYKRLKENWKRPRGLDHKMRRKIKGWPRTVEVGYRGPKATRGLHPSGYKEVLVYNIEELKKIDSKTEAVKIAHAVGKRKRANILREAKKKKITVLNLTEAKESAREETEKEEESTGEETTEEVETEAKEAKSEQKKKRRKRSQKQ